MQHTTTQDVPTATTGAILMQNPEDVLNSKKTITLASRFGTIEVQPDKAIFFPHGMLGMPESNSFCLTELPNIKNRQFKLLQSLTNHSLSFIVVPASADNQLIEEEDVTDACAVLGIANINLLLLFVVTVHETEQGRKISVNAKAPIFVDAITRTATQYVFQNKKYEIQHFIA